MRALRKGWLKPLSERQKQEEEPPTYLMWQDDGLTSEKTANGAMLSLNHGLVSWAVGKAAIFMLHAVSI